MTVTSKVRIYDLAKELKLDTKRLIEEVRREGVDVSVPSNSVSKEMAEKIRNKYFPKKEAAVKRTVKVVKRAARPAEETPAETEAVADEAETIAAAPVEPEVAPAPTPLVPKQPTTARLIKKLTPATRAEPAAAATGEAVAPVAEDEPVEEIEIAAAPSAGQRQPPADVLDVEPINIPAPSPHVRRLRPTPA